MSKISAAVINWIRLKTQASAPSTPAAGYGYLYMKTDKKIYVLNEDGTETCLSDAFSNPMTTEGDIIYGGASGVPTRLAKGTEDYVLTMGASVPAWAAAAAGGGFSTGDIQMVELYRSTLAEAGRFDYSSIPATYDHLIIRALLRSSVSAGADNALIYFNNDTTLTNYFYQKIAFYDGAGNGSAEGDTPTLGEVAAASSVANVPSPVTIFIPNYAGTTFHKVLKAETGLRTAAAQAPQGSSFIIWENTAAIDQITIQPDGYSTDNFIVGSFCQIIGVKTVS